MLRPWHSGELVEPLGSKASWGEVGSLGGDVPFKGILEPWLFSLLLLPGMFLLP